MHIRSTLRSMVCGAIMGSLALTALSRDVLADTPIAKLNGTWTGDGQARFDQGQSEQIKCKAYYDLKSEGSAMALAIRCASSSYKIEMRAHLNLQGDRVTGHWEERSFNAEGGVSGHTTERSLNLAITGAVSGSMSLKIDQSGHRVDITTSGGGLAGVSIKFNRA
jgi:hypothetical protein